MTAKKYRSPALLLALVLLLALASLGLGYGMWSKTLTIDGTVHTGSVDAHWTDCYCFDRGFDPNPDGTDKGKDVGSTTCTIDEKDPQILHVTVDNGYPSYWNDCEVEFTNTGTIPFKIQDYGVTPLNFTLASGNGVGDGEVWVDFVNGCGFQLETNESAASSLKFHVEQPAEQNSTYEYDVEILLVQWNEYDPSLCP